jgi:hypothetical protein
MPNNEGCHSKNALKNYFRTTSRNLPGILGYALLEPTFDILYSSV